MVWFICFYYTLNPSFGDHLIRSHPAPHARCSREAPAGVAVKIEGAGVVCYYTLHPTPYTLNPDPVATAPGSDTPGLTLIKLAFWFFLIGADMAGLDLRA